MESILHIVTLNIPYPPDYGGIIDSFYRIKTLSEAGIGIHLHCYEYGRKPSRELEQYCLSVNYYKRDISIIKHFTIDPYIVSTRNSKELLVNLLKDDHPVFFDGIHTTFFIRYPALMGRRKLVRMHNIEHKYYKALADLEENPFKQLFFSTEAIRLKGYEKVLNNADYILTVSESDQRYYEKRFGNSELIPSFHPFDQLESIPGSGDYIIFHGDLSVNENVIVAEHLIKHIFSRIPHKCIIAGKNPNQRLISASDQFGNIRIIPNPDDARMKELIKNAHINLMYSLGETGLKLKLLIALFSGRHCLANSNITDGTLLKKACINQDSADGIINEINDLMNIPFTEEMIEERSGYLSPYSNSFNAERIRNLLFTERSS